MSDPAAERLRAELVAVLAGECDDPDRAADAILARFRPSVSTVRGRLIGGLKPGDTIVAATYGDPDSQRYEHLSLTTPWQVRGG